MQTITRTYVCKRLRMCRYLIEHGFKPYKITPDRDNPRYNVYLFDHTDKLAEAVMAYIMEARTRRNEVR